MKLPFHLAAVFGALIVLFGCQTTPDSGQSTDAGKKAQMRRKNWFRK